jgi:putative cardiolipin synthase
LDLIVTRVTNLTQVLSLVLFLHGCSTVAFDEEKTVTSAFDDARDSAFGQFLDDWQQQHPGLTGFYPLNDGMDALGARLRLIEGAQRTVDAQYFLMKNDDAGEVFAHSLLRAADRGVRVRLLLDDVFTSVEDDILGLLNRHPNIEIRLYNPVSRRGIYYLNYAGDFSRANRRMHSKSLTGDNAFTIIGGRNIADEYFALKAGTEFLDYDVLAYGSVAAEVATQFDEFWNSTLAVPMEVLHNEFTEEDLATERAEIDEEVTLGHHSIYSKAINSDHMLSLVDGTGTSYLAPAALLHDGVAKLENPIDISHMTLISELGDLIKKSEKSVLVITPYFIPTAGGINFWGEVLNTGRSVTIITNSLASTNHVPVHAGYSRYRKQMLELGASVYEIRAGTMGAKTEAAAGSSQNLTLHTKLMVIDERYLFVGSLNLDPRSIEINAEMGLLIDSPEMSQLLLRSVETATDELAYQVVLDERGKLNWLTRVDGSDMIETKEPQTSWWRRFQSRIYRILPESQL